MMENGHVPRETKRLKRSHAEAKAGSGPAEVPARQAAAAVSAEDDLLLLEAGGSAEAALLELQVPARCHAQLAQPGRGFCHAACCTRCISRTERALPAALLSVDRAGAATGARQQSPAARPVGRRPGSWWRRCAWTMRARTRWTRLWPGSAPR